MKLSSLELVFIQLLAKGITTNISYNELKNLAREEVIVIPQK